MTKAFAVANGAALAAFALSAAVQYNDPDPWRWAAIYLAAVIACVLAFRRPGPRGWLVPGLVGLVALLWAATLAPGVFREARFADIVGRMHETRPAVEETREMLGLAIVAAWMGFLTFRARRQP